jgi:hypothetical protein
MSTYVSNLNQHQGDDDIPDFEHEEPLRFHLLKAMQTQVIVPMRE